MWGPAAKSRMTLLLASATLGSRVEENFSRKIPAKSFLSWNDEQLKHRSFPYTKCR